MLRNVSSCPAHAALPANQPNPAEIAATLTVNLDDFTSAAQIDERDILKGKILRDDRAPAVRAEFDLSHAQSLVERRFFAKPAQIGELG